MSTNASPAEQPPTGDLGNTADYEQALAHLEKLQEQLDTLRSAIPSHVTPLLRPGTSKSQMFAEVKKAALQSRAAMKAFRDDWSSEQTQQLLARSRESLQRDGDCGRAGEVARYGWART
ncbi:hypothetical protein B0A50_04638 [Salinomyces thailandicus]|uniref:Uncharacterized protein n=1 Tax=Salinomyces thailandicus TaxID=706561 RepID=A0A4U0TUY2_9PEZI|nr:hypothetical protein B0A50_04638 [Salinomyces thailandica]